MILLHGWPYDIHAYEEVAPRFDGTLKPVQASYEHVVGASQENRNATSAASHERGWSGAFVKLVRQLGALNPEGT